MQTQRCGEILYGAGGWFSGAELARHLAGGIGLLGDRASLFPRLLQRQGRGRRQHTRDHAVVHTYRVSASHTRSVDVIIDTTLVR